jgi:hypothetical protein
MKNKLMDLHTELHETLFDTLKRITDRNIDGEALEKELNRAKMVVDVAEQTVKNGMFMAALYRLNNSTTGMKAAGRLLE